MLKKLLKQEAKSQGKTILGMYGALAVATLLVMILFLLQKSIAGPMETIFLIGCTIYGVTIIVVFIVNFVYLCFHFYQSMYSQQGYLTHTLPVKTTRILHVKIIVSFGYLFLTGIFTILSFFVIGFVSDGISVSSMFDVMLKAVQGISDTWGIPGAVFLLFWLVAMVLGFLNALLMFFAGCSIGQLAHRSKGAYGIAAGIGLYYFSQIISLILILLSVFVLFSNIRGKEAVPWAMGGSCLLMAGWTVVYYLISRIIVQKHLNLE